MLKNYMSKSLFSKSVGAVAFAFATGLAFTSQAHDFWLSPELYTPASAGTVNVSVMIGHPEDQMEWAISPHRIIALRSIGPDGITDHQARIADYRKSKALPITLGQDGLHILTIETTDAVSELSAEKFNDYIEEEGLLPIKVDRILKRTTNQPGKEIYSRRGKTLIQTGSLGESDPAYLTKPVGMTLEVVPTANPARLKEGEAMTSVIYYRGVPMKGVTIGLIDLDGSEGITALKKTDARGRVTFERPKQGSWMLHAVWSDPLEGSNRADYDTIFSSLSFAVE